jgi:hypothetical protein
MSAFRLQRNPKTNARKKEGFLEINNTPSKLAE